ncbi:uncharacterized protein LOC126854105 [Cataglyphis hispanica]|uniref:uncharacterized protein LOC126854105 n=1 Tax=Cataglyphis hispanica TaxID=1086592 RepID=UPI002180402F|nr:uncharacterized protein LOC126854105 [Cataglyphis hispanica]
MSSNRTVTMKKSGWDAQINANGYFNFCILYMLLGFREDYKRVVINARLELILKRLHSNNNCLIGNLALEPRITKYSWAIKTTTQLEKPRYVVFALQTGRKNIMSEDMNRFDDCKLNTVKLYLNSECYPYDDMNLDFDKNRWSILYDTYQHFCKNYYVYEYQETSITVSQFLRNGPFVIIDCSRQNKSVKSATVDVRLEFECKENVPMNTTAYCLIIYDSVIQYNSLINVVRKII